MINEKQICAFLTLQNAVDYFVAKGIPLDVVNIGTGADPWLEREDAVFNWVQPTGGR